jgi:transposase-like protein
MAPRLTPDEKAAARELYLKDKSLSVAAVAGMFGVGHTVMLDVLKGITRPAGGRPHTTMTTATMIRLRNDEGLTLVEIARQAGISESGVLRRIQRASDKKKGRGKK